MHIHSRPYQREFSSCQPLLVFEGVFLHSLIMYMVRARSWPALYSIHALDHAGILKNATQTKLVHLAALISLALVPVGQIPCLPFRCFSIPSVQLGMKLQSLRGTSTTMLQHDMAGSLKTGINGISVPNCPRIWLMICVCSRTASSLMNLCGHTRSWS